MARKPIAFVSPCSELKACGFFPLPSSPRTVTLALDDGTYETSVGRPSGNSNIDFASRRTPPPYPATITKIQVFFGGAPDELQVAIPSRCLSPRTQAAGFLNPKSGECIPQRSYIGTDGINFILTEAISRDLASNFAIRAVVELR